MHVSLFLVQFKFNFVPVGQHDLLRLTAAAARGVGSAAKRRRSALCATVAPCSGGMCRLASVFLLGLPRILLFNLCPRFYADAARPMLPCRTRPYVHPDLCAGGRS